MEFSRHHFLKTPRFDLSANHLAKGGLIHLHAHAKSSVDWNPFEYSEDNVR